jgi:hypothetical protein
MAAARGSDKKRRDQEVSREAEYACSEHIGGNTALHRLSALNFCRIFEDSTTDAANRSEVSCSSGTCYGFTLPDESALDLRVLAIAMQTELEPSRTNER